MKAIAPTALLAAALAFSGLMAPPEVEAQIIFVPGTRQPGQDVTVLSKHDAYFNGDTVIIYPRDLGPLVGTHTLDRSVSVGVLRLSEVIEDGDTVVAESQGAVVAQSAKRLMANDPDAPRNVVFVTYGDPTNRDGGVMTKLPLDLPGITRVWADEETPYDTVTINREYDLVGDAPDKPNLISWLNAVAGMALGNHNYNPTTITEEDKLQVTTTTNSQGATNTTVLIRNEGYIPLVRVLDNAGVVDDRHARILDRYLKPVVDSGYDRTQDLEGGEDPDEVSPPRERKSSPKSAKTGKTEPRKARSHQGGNE